MTVSYLLMLLALFDVCGTSTTSQKSARYTESSSSGLTVAEQLRQSSLSPLSSSLKTASGRRPLSIQLATLLPISDSRRPFSASKIRPAADLATNYIRSMIQPTGNKRKLRQESNSADDKDDDDSTPSFTTVAYRDSMCSEVNGMNEAINYFVAGPPAVFFGPVCDYAAAPVARQALFWNIPVVSTGALALDFFSRRRSVYPLLTRAGPVNLLGLADGLMEAMRMWYWRRVTVLYEREAHSSVIPPFCHLTTESIVYKLSRAPADVIEAHDYYKLVESASPSASSAGAGTGSSLTLEQVLVHEVGLEFAVVILCASPETVRKIMIKAAEHNFDNGEYVFFNIDLFSSRSKLEKPWHDANDTEERNEKARRAYESLMTITLRKPDSERYRNFSEQVKAIAKERYGDTTYGDGEVNSFVGAFHDAVILYALALNETLAEGLDPTNGTDITRRMWNRTFEGITGTVSIDENGDRNADYSLLDMNPETGIFEVVANYYGSSKKYVVVEGREIHWGGGRTSPPPDVPECGFDGSKCPKEEPFPLYGVAIIVLAALLLIVSTSVLLVYRHYRLEAALAEVNWRIRWDDIMFGAQEKRKLEQSGSRLSLARRDSGSVNTVASVDTIAIHLSNIGSKQIFTKTGSYKSTLVAIKKIVRPFNITKPLLMDFKTMRDLQNDHIVRFIGVCIDAPNQCILSEYCQKGSLQDVLENEQIKLDSMFKFSLIQDIVRGMAYLHSSDIKSHGNLKSSNCVVDSRFVLKLTDFGLPSLRGRDDLQTEDDSYVYYRAKLWTAPELLRMHEMQPPEGTQKGDVYSFAIICQEIIYRNGPFWIENMLDISPQEIYKQIKNGLKPFFRPTLLSLTAASAAEEEDYGDGCCSEELVTMIRRCWAEDPIERPDFHSLKAIIKRINKDGDCSGNLLDNLLSRMEQYAYNLEGLVEARTADYLEQKKKAEDLLYMMLPRSVAVQLMHGQTVKAEKYESVSIYFSDICGFTSMSAESTPMQVVDFLNDLYTTFDSVIDMFDVYKVETIGDAYMVVSGLPVRNGVLHAREIARMAISLLNAVKSFKIRHRPHDQLKLRIGLHSGPVCAGIVGLKMPRYCLFGDTVNTASRMESNGEPLRIHVSPYLKELLDSFETFVLQLRGPVAMKGKGEVVTWWLTGENNPDFPDLAPPSSSSHVEKSIEVDKVKIY